jgi:zinc transport system substrate-binding protein
MARFHIVRALVVQVGAAGLALAAAGMLAACGDNSSTSGTGATSTATSSDQVKVAAAFYPIEELVRQVGGTSVDVVDLTPPGGEPHDLELTPGQVEQLQSADVVFYLGRGFQPSVEKVIRSLPASVVKVDLLDSVELLPLTPDSGDTTGNVDPHVWVDPANMTAMTEVVRSTLASTDQASADYVSANAARYSATLADLDRAYATELQNCAGRTFVTTHRAFAYLAHRYDLTQIPIAGISPDAEPDPKSLEAVATAAKKYGVSVVFFEAQVPKRLAETIAREIGATTDSLDPVETITKDSLAAGATYSSIMQANLASLVKALDCK